MRNIFVIEFSEFSESIQGRLKSHYVNFYDQWNIKELKSQN